jgi:hypothetical protein
MLVEVVAEFKTMRQYLAMRKLGSVPNFYRIFANFCPEDVRAGDFIVTRVTERVMQE